MIIVTEQVVDWKAITERLVEKGECYGTCS